MNLLAEIQKVFQLRELDVSERVKILETSFVLESHCMPSFSDLNALINLSPKRDTLRIFFHSDNEDQIVTSNIKQCSENDYDEFCENLDSDSTIKVSIIIEKTILDNTFSIYSYSSFSKDLLQLTVIEVMESFSLLLKEREYLIFDLFEQNYFFTTGTLAFVSGDKKTICKNFLRGKRLHSCKETTYFYDMSAFELLPDDFSIEIDCEDNPLTTLFNKIRTILSLIYLSTSSSLENGSLKMQISGQRNIEFIYNLDDIKNNEELFKIYSWIYTDGSSVDKAIIARNIISLHCRYSNLIDVDNKTFSSIQSNYNLYLKNNVTQYLELKNKLAEFICDVVSKTGDYATELLGKFKSNLIAVFGFLFTAVLANIVSDQPLENIFTKDITVIIEFVLLGSAIYMIICVLETKYKFKKAKDSYYALKENYGSVLSEIDLEEIFKNDLLIQKVKKTVNRGILVYTLIWIAFLILSLCIIEYLSSSPVIKSCFQHLLETYYTNR